MILTCQKKINKVAFFLGLFSWLFFAGSSVSAQESVVLSVSPTLFEMTASEQQTWSSNVRVINANPFPITVYAETMNFKPSGDAGQGTLIPVLKQESNGDTLAEWISINKEEILIPAEQTMSVPFTISVPEGSAPGGHFAAILIGTKSFDEGDGGAQVETAQVVTSLVFLRVAGDIIESGNIRQFTTKNAIYESTDATFEVRFENTGNVHLQPQGEIEIRNMWGAVRGTVPINKNSQFGNVLPESVRAYTFHWNSEFSLADVGRHKAIVTLAYGDETRQFVDAQTTFWVIPWKLLLLTVFLIATFISLVVWAIKLYVRKMLQLAGVTPELHRQQRVRRVSVAAPIEAGILDLRDELENGSGSIVDKFKKLAKQYKVFLLLAAAIVTLLVLFVWYGVLMITSDFEYEVQYEQADGSTVLLTEPSISSADSAAIDLVVVNNSGQADAITALQQDLFESGNAIVLKEKEERYEGVKERSVLVYDPAQLELVEQLQDVFPDVLVSSFVSDDPEDDAVILYLGSDLLGN